MKQNQNSQIIHIISAGTQVVTRFDIQEPHGGSVHPGGAVGIVIKSPAGRRGAHVLPAEEVVGLKQGKETIEKSTWNNGLEIDLVTHDVKKFFSLLLKSNGYVLEQLLSPLVLSTMPQHNELKDIAVRCITKHHAHHYLGFARTQWKLFLKGDPPRCKPLLYVYRVLLTGIHLMRTGQIEANLTDLNEEFKLLHRGANRKKKSWR